MASIRKLKRNPHWFACITKPDGMRTHRSTGIPIEAPTKDERQKNRKGAFEIACEWERASRTAARRGLPPYQAPAIVNEILRRVGVLGADKVARRRLFIVIWRA